MRELCQKLKSTKTRHSLGLERTSKFPLPNRSLCKVNGLFNWNFFVLLLLNEFVFVKKSTSNLCPEKSWKSFNNPAVNCRLTKHLNRNYLLPSQPVHPHTDAGNESLCYEKFDLFDDCETRRGAALNRFFIHEQSLAKPTSTKSGCRSFSN